MLMLLLNILTDQKIRSTDLLLIYDLPKIDLSFDIYIRV